MKRSSRARIGATVALGAVALALITGCSSEESDGSKSTDAGDAGNGSSTEAAKALSAAELKKLLLTQGDLDAKKFKIEDTSDLPKSKSEAEVSKAECEPLLWSMVALPPGDTDAQASTGVSEVPAGADTADPENLEAAFDVNATFVGLSSYEGDGAEKALKAVSEGVSACAGGYSFTGDGETTKVNKVSAAEGSGKGDESVAYTQEVAMDGASAAGFTIEVVRKGNTVATFYTMNLAALAGESTKPAATSAELITAQVDKIK